MSDRDYNSPEYERPNYETAEEYNRARKERETQMAEEGQNPYGNSYQYNGYTNASNRVYTGSTMTDATGKPLQNRFALKLVLSIMMIMGCCCSNFFLVIVGIIALVFTCKANTAYQQGDAESFQRNAKVSSVLLGIGGVVLALVLIVGVIFFSVVNQDFKDTTGTNMWELFDEEIWDDFEDVLGINPDYEEPEVSYERFADRETPLPDCFKDFSIAGHKCSMPLSYRALQEANLSLDDFSESMEIRQGDLEVFSLYWDEWCFGNVCFTNYWETTMDIANSRISSITFYNEPDAPAKLVFFGDITWESSYEEIEKLLGKPQYIYTEEYETLGTYKHYTWSFSEEGNSQGVVASFVNGELYEITIEWFDK